MKTLQECLEYARRMFAEYDVKIEVLYDADMDDPEELEKYVDLANEYECYIDDLETALSTMRYLSEEMAK